MGINDLSHLGLNPEDHIEVRLIDQGDGANPNLQLVMKEAAAAVAQFRAEGKRVLLHCVAAQSRTPAVAALYARDHLGVHTDSALAEVCAVLPAANPNHEFRAVILNEKEEL